MTERKSVMHLNKKMTERKSVMHLGTPGMNTHALCRDKTPGRRLTTDIDLVTCPKCLKQLGEEIEAKPVAYRHFADPFAPVEPYCGDFSATERREATTPNKEYVTCPKCLALLKRSDRHPDLGDETHYYDVGDIAVIDVIRAKLTLNQLRGYYLGNVIKYALRMNHKNQGAQAKGDAAKLANYTVWLNETYHDAEPRK